MAANDTIIDALTKYFIKCDLLRDGAMRVDYLGEKPVEYTLETMPTDPIMKRYADFMPKIPPRTRRPSIRTP